MQIKAVLPCALRFRTLKAVNPVNRSTPVTLWQGFFLLLPVQAINILHLQKLEPRLNPVENLYPQLDRR